MLTLVSDYCLLFSHNEQYLLTSCSCIVPKVFHILYMLRVHSTVFALVNLGEKCLKIRVAAHFDKN